jgi:hypothetical protein
MSVALSADGNVAVVGGVEGIGPGATALVWMRSNGVWTQQGGKLVGTGSVRRTDQTQPYVSVALSSDSKTAFIGGRSDDGFTGAAWVFSSATAPATPIGIIATAVTSTRVDVSWGASTGATSYQIDRQAAGGGFSQIGTSVLNTFSDATASPDSAYLYRVRAVSTAGTSASSAPDLAGTVVFVDTP